MKFSPARYDGGVLPLLCAALAAPLPEPSPLQVRAIAGALVERQSHGEVDLGLRSGPWSAELYTDTLDLRWAPEFPGGRAWLDVRAAGFASGLMITPWFEDAPAPDMALVAWSVGPEVGAVAHLPRGLWAGGGAGLRVLGFGARDETVVPVPGVWLSGGPFAAVGWWGRPATLQLRGGVDFAAEVVDAPGDTTWGLHGPVAAPVAPWVDGELVFRPRWFVAPRAELRAGWSSGRGAATAFRIGGSMPYQVPLTGYGWSRWWVSRYAAARVAFQVGHADAAPGSGVGGQPVEATARVVVRGGLVADAVVSTGIEGFPGCPPSEWEACDQRFTADRADLGVGAQLAARYQHGWLQLEAGYGLGSAQAGIDATTLLVRVGVDWVPLRTPPR